MGSYTANFPVNPNPKLWPIFEKSDKSSKYSGLFFRVLGGNSSSFTAVQEENSPRLVGVKYTRSNQYDSVDISANDDWSEAVRSGIFEGWRSGISFKVSSGEVRPRNQAIRIWKRVQ